MKKTVMLMAVLLLTLAGCSGSQTTRIEDYSWVMASVQSVEEGGQTIAYGEGEASTSDSGKQMQWTCTAEDGGLTLTDQTNNKTYVGTYELSETAPDSCIYNVVLDGTDGMAVVAMTAYDDGTEVPTCILSIGDYAINFFAA